MDQVNPSRQTDHVTVEKIINNSGGCGLFQGLLLLSSYACMIPIVWSAYFMAFGNVIPNWRCLDSDINPRGLESLIWNETTLPKGNKSDMSCEVFESCQHIEFEKGISTTVSEWGLLCSRQWITSFMMSIQMVGFFIGSFGGGRLIDTFGRKSVLFGSVLMNGALSLIAAFSVNWQMFAALVLLLGIPCGSVISCVFLFLAEFLPIRRRGITSTAPVWGTCTLTFAALTAVLKNWRSIYIANAVISSLLCLLAFWVPDSMRWLAVRGRLHAAEDVAHKIARINRKPTPELSILAMLYERQTQISESESKPKYGFADIFRRGFYKHTLITCFIWFTLIIITYAIAFNVKVLPGDFSVNLSLIAGFTIVFYPVVLWAIEKLGRKLGVIIFFSFACVCCFSIAAVNLVSVPQHVRNICLTVFSVLAYGTLECGWSIVVVFTYELFPTVVRGIGFGCANGISRFGGLIAPYLIPPNLESFYIYYLVYGTAVAIAILLIILLPETKGSPLQDTFEKGPEEIFETRDQNNVQDNYKC